MRKPKCYGWSNFPVILDIPRRFFCVAVVSFVRHCVQLRLVQCTRRRYNVRRAKKAICFKEAELIASHAIETRKEIGFLRRSQQKTVRMPSVFIERTIRFYCKSFIIIEISGRITIQASPFDSPTVVTIPFFF